MISIKTIIICAIFAIPITWFIGNTIETTAHAQRGTYMMDKCRELSDRADKGRLNPGRQATATVAQAYCLGAIAEEIGYITP